MIKYIRLGLFYCFFHIVCSPYGVLAAPPQAINAGYVLNTFACNSFSESSVETKGAGSAESQWFLWSFFGRKADQNTLVVNRDGSITLLGDTTGPNGQIATATVKKGSKGYAGQAFGGGGYFEAVVKFDPNDTIGVKGHPSFWAMSLEHLIGKGAEWSGLGEEYRHFIEVDILEYMVVEENEDQNYYGVNIHDWYGVFKKSCPGKPFCHDWLKYGDVKVEVPIGTDFLEYHKYGFLWIPATGGRPGLAKFYFDDVQVGKTVKWENFEEQLPPPTNRSWKFGILDNHHLVLILGTAPGQPMTVKSVNVWQATSSHNMN